MVQEVATIRFYKVSKCGFYKFGAEKPLFGSLEDTLTQLQSWSAGSDLSLTKISDVNEASDSHPVYLFGIEKHGDEWVYATWNEVPSSELGVASVELNSKVGHPQVHDNPVAENTIPGYATYFWAIPKKNLVASIRFGRMITGQRPMTEYLSQFMARQSSYAVSEKDEDGDTVVIGYSNTADQSLKPVKPYIKLGAYAKDGPTDLIIKNRSRIRKVIRRGHVTSKKKMDKALWQKAIGFVRGNEDKAHEVMALSHSIYLELEYQPSLEELKSMIEREEKDESADGWDDLGFVLRGDANKIHWVGRSQAMADFNLNIERLGPETIALPSLAESLSAQRDSIIAILK